jgi:predicted nucleotidyltransferase component of viral defense system
MADMILPKSKDAVHKAWLYRVLCGIADDAVLAQVLYFKGGTCAAMLGYLDRFSVDLDFDFVGGSSSILDTRNRLASVFDDLGITIRDQSRVGLQYFLKYPVPDGARNTMKIDASFPPPKANTYEARRLDVIDRIMHCQTVETMMANKLVALMDRYLHNEAIAGRDLYDIHHFFLQGYRYNVDVIYERTGKDLKQFLTDMVEFVERRITNTIIDQDLNTLLPYVQFSRIRGILKREVLLFVRDEIKRVE